MPESNKYCCKRETAARQRAKAQFHITWTRGRLNQKLIGIGQVIAGTAGVPPAEVAIQIKITSLILVRLSGIQRKRAGRPRSQQSLDRSQPRYSRGVPTFSVAINWVVRSVTLATGTGTRAAGNSLVSSVSGSSLVEPGPGSFLELKAWSRIGARTPP